MSLKSRLRRLERQCEPVWEAPFVIIENDEDAERAEALCERYAEEIKRDAARGRQLFGVDFR